MNNLLCGKTAKTLCPHPQIVVVTDLVEVVGGQAGGKRGGKNYKKYKKAEDILSLRRVADTDLFGRVEKCLSHHKMSNPQIWEIDKFPKPTIGAFLGCAL